MANLQLNTDKCVIAQPHVNYLGYVLSEKGVSASPDKIKAVRDYTTPKNVKDVRAFLGLASFYLRLVHDFATIAKPLTELTKKDRLFWWVLVKIKPLRALRINCVEGPFWHTLILSYHLSSLLMHQR